MLREAYCRHGITEYTEFFLEIFSVYSVIPWRINFGMLEALKNKREVQCLRYRQHGIVAGFIISSFN